MADKELILGRMGLDGRAYWEERGRMRIPRKLAAKVIALERGVTVSEMVGGRSVKPTKPVAFYDARGDPCFIIGAGACEAAQMEDIVAQKREAVRFSDDELAERAGFIRREDAGQAYADAIQERMDHHKRNPVTDPAPRSFRE